MLQKKNNNNDQAPTKEVLEDILCESESRISMPSIFTPSYQPSERIPFSPEPSELSEHSEPSEHLETSERKSDFQEMSNFIFNEKEVPAQHKNTPRFFGRIAIKYLKKYQSEYSEEQYEKIIKECEELAQWEKRQIKNKNGKKKKNVFLMEHLEFLLTDSSVFGKEGTRINRLVFRKILKKEAITQLMDPKSQVRQNKLHYLRAIKTYSLRCMSMNLPKRNQII